MTKCLLVTYMYLCFTVYAAYSKKSKTDEKLNSLENLVRSEIYLLNEKIQTEKEERENFMERLNETLGYFKEKSAAVTAAKPQSGSNIDMESQIVNTEENRKVIRELSESLTRTKRGILAEKKARKTDFRALITELTYIKENLTDILNNQNIMIENSNGTIKNQDMMIKNQNDIVKNQYEMIKNQNEMIKNQNDTIKNQNDIIKIQNEMFSRTIAIQNADDELRMKCENLEQTFEHKLDKLQDTLLLFQNISEQIAAVDKRTQDTVAIVLSIAQNTDLPVRLVNGSGPYEGRVEINYKGRHGTVCDDLWDEKAAKVVCRMIGYSGGTAFKGPKHNFGRGVGDILLDNVKCTGDERSLFDCPHNRMGVNDCGHHEDAGVKCSL